MVIKFVIFFPIYLIVLLIEMLRANLDVAMRVINPSLPINPGIVEFKTTLKSDLLKFILANSITLTPGTLTMDVKDDSFFVHWIDVKGNSGDDYRRAICGRLESILKRIEG